jgi:hypothetical protein
MKYFKTWCFYWTMGDVLNAFLLAEQLLEWSSSDTQMIVKHIFKNNFHPLGFKYFSGGTCHFLKEFFGYLFVSSQTEDGANAQNRDCFVAMPNKKIALFTLSKKIAQVCYLTTTISATI